MVDCGEKYLLVVVKMVLHLTMINCYYLNLFIQVVVDGDKIVNRDKLW